MATISLTITDGGQLVSGATVIVGETVATGLITDVAGKVTKTVPDAFAIVASVLVEISGVVRGSFGPLFLKAGTSQTLDIGATAPL